MEVLDTGHLDSIEELEEVALSIFIPHWQVVRKRESLLSRKHLDAHYVVVILRAHIFHSKRASFVNEFFVSAHCLIGTFGEVSVEAAQKVRRVAAEFRPGEGELVEGLEEFVALFHRQQVVVFLLGETHAEFAAAQERLFSHNRYLDYSIQGRLLEEEVFHSKKVEFFHGNYVFVVLVQFLQVLVVMRNLSLLALLTLVLLQNLVEFLLQQRYLVVLARLVVSESLRVLVLDV